MSQQLQLIDQLLAATPQPRWQRFLSAMRDQLQLPMADVLAKVPGETVADRARFLGVARNTYYEWLNEGFRPSLRQALALEELTGFPAAQIHGQLEEGGDDEAGRPIAVKSVRVAKAVAKVSRGAGGVRGAHGRVVPEQGKRRHARPVHRRSRERPGPDA
jgi:hypothetical protein